MVGVERVPQAEGVSEHADPDREHGMLAAEVVVLGRHEAEKHPEADEMQQDDEPGHAGQRAPVRTGQTASEPRERGALDHGPGAIDDRRGIGHQFLQRMWGPCDRIRGAPPIASNWQ